MRWKGGIETFFIIEEGVFGGANQDAHGRVGVLSVEDGEEEERVQCE